MVYHEAVYDEPLIFEYRSGTTYKLPGLEGKQNIDLPENLLRKELNLPEVSEYDVVRHYTRLSQMNYSVDLGIYPLGSCTMKFNPKYADAITSSGLLTGRFTGWFFNSSGESFELSMRASTNLSRSCFDTVSVGSIIIAS